MSPIDALPSMEESLGISGSSDLHQLPEFTRSLLKVSVTVSVSIANSRRPITQLLDIGPGSILQFDKHFETPLVLEANGEPIAHGIAVRVGENFGFQTTEILLPPERFWSVQPPQGKKNSSDPQA